VNSSNQPAAIRTTEMADPFLLPAHPGSPGKRATKRMLLLTKIY